MIAAIIDLFVLAATISVVVIYVLAWRRSDPAEPWYWRAWFASKESATLLWSYFVVLATGILTALAAIASIFDPGTVATIQSNLPPNWLAGFLILITLVTIAARIRSLIKD